ncbi:hypothetical protein ACHHV8_29890 [Paenibacillus sp. TAB 01]|uniref:hypothetical protein n=1 Tax=Paenibacillus sp. TAB 01 TaxID=3368988 RepID=UPI003752C02F
MRNVVLQLENSHVLQMHWTEQFFKQSEKEVRQGDFIEAMHNVMFYASLYIQRQQEQEAGGISEQIRLPLAWQWGGEEDIVAKVKAQVPPRYEQVLDCSLAVTAEDGGCRDTSMHFEPEAELREQAADFIRYIQYRLQFPGSSMGASGRAQRLWG